MGYVRFAVQGCGGIWASGFGGGFWGIGLMVYLRPSALNPKP